MLQRESMSEIMDEWSGDDILIGGGIDDSKTEKAERKATLKAMGIKPLDPFSSPLMTATSNPKKPGVGKGRWRDSPRQVARRNGVSRYWGRPCKANHDSARYVSTGQCVECLAILGRLKARAQARLDKNITRM